MTNNEMRQAFDYRLKGYSYRKIGELLNYDDVTIERSLRNIMDRKRPRLGKNTPPIIAEALQEKFDGNVADMAKYLGVSEQHMRKVLRGERRLNHKKEVLLAMTARCHAEDLYDRDEDYYSEEKIEAEDD